MSVLATVEIRYHNNTNTLPSLNFTTAWTKLVLNFNINILKCYYRSKYENVALYCNTVMSDNVYVRRQTPRCTSNLLFTAEVNEKRLKAFCRQQKKVRSCNQTPESHPTLKNSSAYQLTRRRTVDSDNIYHVTAFMFLHPQKWEFVQQSNNNWAFLSLGFLINSGIDFLLLWNPKFHNHKNGSPPFYSIVSNPDLFHLLTSYLYSSRFIYYGLIYY